MRNINWLKLISPSRRPGGGRSRKDCDDDSFCSSPNVNEEYLKAFRTKSYIEICNIAQGQLGETNTRRLSSSPSSLPLFLHLTEHLLEPRQETIESLNVHRLLVEYFEASLEACLYCDTILEGIYQMRLAYRKIKRVLKLSKMVLNRTDTDQAQIKAICGDLASFTLQRNPLSIISPGQFRDIHDRYMVLLRRLKSQGSKIRQRLKLKRICKKVGGISLVISHSALVIALLVLAFHSVVGIVAAPIVAGCFLGLYTKRMKSVQGKQNTRASEKLCEQLDIAAKGVYILINDFDTMSRMVKRLHDEVEHWKAVADMCVKSGKCEILKPALREFDAQDSSFLDQLKELEEHIYLCFLTINRSRRLVIEEIMDKQS